MKVAHEWLKAYVGDSIPDPEKIEELLTFHAFEIDGREAVGKHEVIDVDVLPNRSSDCLCHRGIAREIATLTGKPLAHDPFSEEVRLEPKTNAIKISIEDSESCMRFGLALMDGISVGESPLWLREQLEAIGQRPINNVVDATNYVMFALGQPLHAYDAKKLEKDGSWHYNIRFAKDGEKVSILGGDEYELDPSVQLIVDEHTDTPIGIAGIKGGNYAEVDHETTSIILEAGHFERAVTRKAAQKLKLQTDASKRFENEVSRDVIPYALTECVKLLEDIAKGNCVGYVDEYPTKKTNAEVTMSLAVCNARLGLELSETDVEDILLRLGFTYTKDGSVWKIVAPFDRTDINIEDDVIEEVGRVYGYSHVESVVPETVDLAELNKRHIYSERIRKILIELGYSEVITSSFRKKDEIHLLNALASDKEYLRSSLRKNLWEVLDKNMPNADLLGKRAIHVFEIGTVFTKSGDGIEEHVSVALGARTKQQGYTGKDDAALDEAREALEKMFGTSINHAIEKGVLEFNLTDLLEEVPDVNAYDPFEKTPDASYKPFSSFPFIARDIALWVSEGTSAEDVENVLNEAAGDLRVLTTLFDEFSKDGRTSYAFRLVFQSTNRTLTDTEVADVMRDVERAADKEKWEVR